MLHDPAAIEELLSATDADQLGEVLLRLEQEALGSP